MIPTMFTNGYNYTECRGIASGIDLKNEGRLFLVHGRNGCYTWPLLRVYAVEMGVPVVCVSTEVSGRGIAARMAILENTLQRFEPKCPDFNAEMERYGKAITDIGRAPIAIIDDHPGTQDEILSKALASARSLDAKIIIFDVICAFEPERLQEFAKKAGIPVVAFCNNPRLMEKVRGFFDKVIELA
ncbi:MAG: hypothetical protein MJY60_05395 [Bacteroidales bacterium]|nr:hypothetical protein [Bacteroidales bacterium]